MNPLKVFRSMFSRSIKSPAEAVAECERKRKIALAQRPPVYDNLVTPPSIKKKVNVLQFGAYGDMFYIIADKTLSFDCWSCEPYITFARAGDVTAFPRTDIPPSRLFIGAEAYLNERRLVVANFQTKTKSPSKMGNTVNIYIYAAEDTFGCTLQHTYTFDAQDCCGSGFLGRLCSLDVTHHAVAFGDLSNNPYISFGAVTIPADELATEIADQRPPLKCDALQDAFFKPDGTYYSATAIPAGDNALVLRVCVDDAHITAFERAVVMPLQLGTVTAQHIECAVLTLKCISRETGNIERVLVRVTIEQENAAEEELGDRAVAFLLNIPTNEVVCMCVLRGPYYLCALSADGESILQLRKK
jgi:hypothetical protein